MQLEKNRRGRELRVVLSGELDHHNAAIIREEIDRELDGSVKLLTLDMSGITFMDSSGIGLIIGRYKLLERRGGSVAVINADARVDRIFEMSGLYQIVDRMA